MVGRLSSRSLEKEVLEFLLVAASYRMLVRAMTHAVMPVPLVHSSPEDKAPVFCTLSLRASCCTTIPVALAWPSPLKAGMPSVLPPMIPQQAR